MKKKYVLKKSFKKKLFQLGVILILIIILKNLFDFRVVDIKFENKIKVYFSKDNVSCIISNTSPTLSDEWVVSNNKVCILDYKEGFNNIYIKYEDNITNITEDKIFNIDLNDKDTIYIAKGDEYIYLNGLIGNIEKFKYDISDKNVIEFKDGIIKGIENGTSNLNISADKEYSVKVVVTDLITSNYLSDSFDFDKEELKCGIYSKEENDLLDKILKDRINDAGYKTRAGAVEAARFLMLEFPYKINYFHENGRQTTNNVDGEGRYYHEGLYLHESRFENITGKKTGSKTWGCSMFSEPQNKYMDNGLNCSGFVSWVLLNAGFDVKDVGAGFSNNSDLTDFGELVKLSDSTINNIKVGDLLHSEHSGGHIGIIIGKDKDYIYVAQALWRMAPISLTKRSDNLNAVQITKYTYKEIQKVLPDLVMMDKLYKEDGNLTNMW